jgi:hypothetical protein
MKTAVTEQDKDLIQNWYNEEVESIDAFIDKLNTAYEHDYGTICHALAAVAVQAAKKMNRQDSGGITGFQAGAVMWEFVRNWMHLEGPMKLVDYNNMLYPQYFSSFDTVINEDIWKYLQTKAQENLDKHLDSTSVSADVLRHWNSIVAGVVPFGYVVQKGESDGS